MRKPNGYGSIKRLSGTRRRPFVFVVSDAGRQHPVEYFATQIEAEIFAADYNKIHMNRSLSGNKITLAELYHRWLPRHIEDTQPSQSTLNSYHNAYQHLAMLHGMPVEDLHYADYQQIIDGMRRHGLSYSSVKKVRSLISLLLKYADKIELATTNYASLLSIGRITLSAGRKSTGYGHPWIVQASILSLSCSTLVCVSAKCYSYKNLTCIYANNISASLGARRLPASVSSRYAIALHRLSMPA